MKKKIENSFRTILMVNELNFLKPTENPFWWNYVY